MNKYRRVFLILAALLSLGMAGCVTPALNKMIKKDTSYAEEVTSVLISEDEKKMVFIGDRYHYIFNAPDVLSSSLKSSFQKSLYFFFEGFWADKNGFWVDKNNDTFGKITITLSESASQDDKEEAIELGYNERSEDPPYLVFLLKGKRYRSGGVATDGVEYKLNYSNVTVLEPRSPLNKAALTALIPITVLIDGVIVIVLAPFALLLTALVAGGGH
jgi:hypothetical protein